MNDGIVISLGCCILNFDYELILVDCECYLLFILQVRDKIQPVSLQFPWLACMMDMYPQYI